LGTSAATKSLTAIDCPHTSEDSTSATAEDPVTRASPPTSEATKLVPTGTHCEALEAAEPDRDVSPPPD
jgi:hypothetical protein